MSRSARVISETGLYHIIFRGINKQNIFEQATDYEKMLEIIKIVKEDMEFDIYAYCLMKNHAHLFIREKNPGDIKKIMHKLLTRYVGWYNFKYNRSGSLIGNRYKSEPIEDESYYLSLIRYIHQNPVKAGFVDDIKNYKWCSYNDYLQSMDDIIDIDATLLMLSENRETALKIFCEFHDEEEKEDFRISDAKRPTDEQLLRRIRKITNGINANEISQLSKVERNIILSKLRTEGLTIGQLERVTGISRGIIARAKNV